MKRITILLVVILMSACSDADVEEFVEEFAFRETLKYKLKKTCGNDDNDCKNAVDAQTAGCMVKSNWRQYLKKQDDKEESSRFIKEFYACLVDAEGKPHFVPK